MVIDVQNDFITGTLALKNGPAGQDGAEVVKPINEVNTEFAAFLNPTSFESVFNDMSMFHFNSYWHRFRLMRMLTAWIGILQIIFPSMTISV